MESNIKNCFRMLQENNINVFKSAIEALKTICDNLIEFPKENKYRNISVGCKIVTEQLLPALGAIELLFEIGFKEDGENFVLPSNASLSKIKNVQLLLNKHCKQFSPSLSQSSNYSKTNVKTKNFFNSISECFINVLRYEDKKLQNITKSFVPITTLQIRAIKKMREVQKDIKLNLNLNKKSKFNENDISFDEFLLSEITHWFKNDFFKWMNNPTCQSCFSNCSFSKYEYNSDPRVSTVEVHKCNVCFKKEKFPRYTDPKILLYTKQGRCGEWANVFTLICRTFGYDARIIFDKTDHVWTEVWSSLSNKWIHIDPCEDIINRPLLYEKGWNKKLSYVIAYSKYEVQDVTWRYTRNYDAVLNRRNLCSEQSLIAFILKLNKERQSSLNLTKAKQQFILKRTLGELIEFLYLPSNIENESNDEHEYGGRTSGDRMWRLARGEISETLKSHVWIVPKGVHKYNLQYNIVKDLYQVYTDDKILESQNKWDNGIYNYKGGIHRKIENDWKMMYLARIPHNDVAEIVWSIEIIEDPVTIELFEFSAKATTFNSGKIEWIIQGLIKDQVIETLSVSNPINFKTSQLKYAKKINIKAKLSGGTGNVSWQHAQIFRQNFNSIEHSLLIFIIINKK